MDVGLMWWRTVIGLGTAGDVLSWIELRARGTNFEAFGLDFFDKSHGLVLASLKIFFCLKIICEFDDKSIVNIIGREK